MEQRAPLGTTKQRPRLPQRAVSGGGHSVSQSVHQRPTLPSRLSNVRSVSQPVNLGDTASTEAVKSERSNTAAFLGNRDVVSSPGVIKLDDDDEEPPAKRAKTSGDTFGSIGNKERVVDDEEVAQATPGALLPSLPKARTTTGRIAGPRQNRPGIDIATRKAHGVESPAIATRVPAPKKVLDFSPWTGNHPEDVLNDAVIKSGYFDKVPSSNQSECNSAKTSLATSLSHKNSSALSLLGYLFTAVLEKRQAVGKSSAPSTFKPPPRVTVTDTKREAWLRDLANPEVPLRKQSRTIPHGIRGKLLMDQCLSKSIPLPRAVWLAKCVGANELRAFKRKGVNGSAAASGESKWVREWTVHVEQFLESVIAMCGQQDWKSKMNYAAGLSAALYTQKLLDADHYLDWIVTSLREAVVDRLPVWIVLVQMYWKDITMFGRRGRRLAEGVLEHLHRITKEGLEVHTLLKARLQQIVAVLAVSNRGCLVLPRTWEKYKYLLKRKDEDVVDGTPTHNVFKRNERIAGPLHKSAANTRNVLLDLYAELDFCIGQDVDLEQLTDSCLRLIENVSALIPALFKWASTPYRYGIARIYISARIVAGLYSMGYDTDTAILQVLGDSKDLSGISIEHAHRVIVYLVQSGAFSVGRYLQWLITSGVLSRGHEVTLATALIAALPTADLSPQVVNTYEMLMRRLGYTAESETLINSATEAIDAAIARPSTVHVDYRAVHLPRDLTMGARFGFCQETLVRLRAMAKDFGLSMEAFATARAVIEAEADISTLASLLAISITSDNNATLAAVADTINLNMESLLALGEFDKLVTILTEQYLALRSLASPDRRLLLSLMCLAERITGKTSLIKLLRDDIAIAEQQNCPAVYSPASDSIIGMHASRLDSDSDIDAVFMSGNTMDEHLMQRVFTRIVERALDPPLSGPEPVSRIGGWLDQLRSVDSTGTLNRLTRNYVRNTLKDRHEGSLALNAVIFLVASDCVSLSTVAEIAKTVGSPAAAANTMSLVLDSGLVTAGLHDPERYRYRLQQEICQADRAGVLYALACVALDATTFDVDDRFLIQFIVRCRHGRSSSLRRVTESETNDKVFGVDAGRMAVAVAKLDHGSDGTASSLDITSLVSMADSLSFMYCGEALQHLVAAADSRTDDVKLCADAIIQAFDGGSEVWPQLLEFAGEAVNRLVCESARNKLLSIATHSAESEQWVDDAVLSRHFDLHAVANGYAHVLDDTPVVVAVTETLKELEQRFPESVDGSCDDLADHTYRLRVILHLCVMHIREAPEESDASRTARSQLLIHLCTLLLSSRLHTDRDLIEYLFDLCSALSDALPLAALRSVVSQIDTKLHHDPRLKSVFGRGSVSMEDTWLALASQVHQPGSQQQRALSRHSSQQQSSSVRLSGGGQGQIMTHQAHQRWPSQSSPAFVRQDGRVASETKLTPYALRHWEVMPDPTPVQGENDASLSLGLFGARKL